MSEVICCLAILLCAVLFINHSEKDLDIHDLLINEFEEYRDKQMTIQKGASDE